MENWRYGSITEDKKVTFSFTDENGITYALADLLGYGVKFVDTDGRVILKAGTIDGYDAAAAVQIQPTEIQINLPAELCPKKNVQVKAITIIEIADPNMPAGKYTDISDNPVTLYQCIRDNVNC